MVDFTVDGSEAVKKTVKKAGTGAHVYVPKDWRDESVLVVRLEEPEAEDGMDPDAPSTSTVIEYDAEFDSGTSLQTDGKQICIKGGDSNDPYGIYAGRWPRQLFENARTISDPETYIGYNRTPEMGVQAVSVDREAWLRHTAIFGSSGYEKSTLLENVMLQWAYGGYGFCYAGIDGPEAEELLRKLPPERLDDVVWVEPFTNGQESQNVVGFNFLQPSVDKDDGRVYTVQKEAISDGVRRLIQDDGWGARMESTLSSVSRAMMEAEEPYTLMDLYMVLDDEQYRRTFIDETDNKKAKQNLQGIDSENDGDSYEALRHRVEQLVQSVNMREFLAHPNAQTTIDELIDDERIILVGNDIANGSPEERRICTNAVIRQVASAAQTRITAPAKGRKTVHLVIDDFGSASPLPDLEELLARRSLRLSVTLCCQHPSQLPEETRKTIFSNCDNIMSMCVAEPNSARIIMQRFGEYDEGDLMELGRYKMFVRTVRGGKQSAPFVAETFPSYPPLRSVEEAEAVKERSRQRYGVPHLDDEDPIKNTVHGPEMD